jgi:hypothetical protein
MTCQMMVSFFNLGFTCVDEFYSLNAFYSINNIVFFQLSSLSLWSMMHLWWFWDIYESILLWPMFCWFFNGSSRGFLSTYAKSSRFLWHHTLNQHIPIDTMYPFGVTHLNTMILIPLCENCKFCIYWYHLVWVFIFLLQYLYCHGIQISKKIKYSYQMGMLKVQY